jgi:photosystem II stability/assembly factor-like uncharacterized protein
MKKNLLILSALFISGICSAQWTRINSTTTETLNDVDFLDQNYGVIVGNRSTILLTTNGGATWTDINNGNISGDIYNVTVTGTDTIYLSTYDFGTASGDVYRTTNGGISWNVKASDPGINHRIDLEWNQASNTLFASASNLLSTQNSGSSWDTLLNYIAGTTSTDLLHFADPQTGHLSGNISGFIGYSAYFFRTEDGGQNWYKGDPFSFPNSHALTTMSFVSADTSYAFTNQYSGWAPSATNGMVRMYNFNRSVPNPGDTSYTFNSQVVNAAMPDYMNDAVFETAMKGYAFGNAAKIYRTQNGGTTWTVEYTDTCSSCAILKSDFENGVGYAVGSNGTLVKFGTTTSVVESSDLQTVNIYPNPGTGKFTIRWGNPGNTLIEVLDIVGNTVLKKEMSFSSQIDLSDSAKGIYMVRLTNRDRQIIKKIIVE